MLWREAHQETTIAHSSCHRNTRLGAAGTGGEVSGVCWGNQGRLSRRGKGSEAGLGSYNRKKESRMAVAKRQRREKPTKIEQRKV